jgi:quercetin dioxygenase-like cupin family protein
MRPVELRAVMSRPPDFADPDGPASFWTIGEMAAGMPWSGRFQGASPRERHGQGDELLHQLEGEVRIEVLIEDREESVNLRAGDVFVVPQGAWHRQTAVGESLRYGLTPTPTDHSESDDPRRDI